jgi:hypothetical protein
MLIVACVLIRPIYASDAHFTTATENEEIDTSQIKLDVGNGFTVFYHEDVLTKRNNPPIEKRNKTSDYEIIVKYQDKFYVADDIKIKVKRYPKKRVVKIKLVKIPDIKGSKKLLKRTKWIKFIY